MTNEERARDWIANSAGNSYELIQSLTTLLTQVQAEARLELVCEFHDKPKLFCGTCAKELAMPHELAIAEVERLMGVLEKVRQHEPKLYCVEGPISQNEGGSYTIASLGCTCGWNSDGKTSEKEKWGDHIAALEHQVSVTGSPRGE